MLPGIEAAVCQDMAVPMDVMQHVINVESSRNPFAIGVVGGALARQPKQLDEALATVRMLEEKGYNFSVGLAQVNRYNLAKYGLDSYEKAFRQCDNLVAGSRILAECYKRSGGDWGKSFSCYYSGNFTTGFRHGYVQKIYDSISRSQRVAAVGGVNPIDVVPRGGERRSVKVEHHPQFDSPARSRIIAPNTATAAAYAQALPDDPARAFVVYPSTKAAVRGSLLNTADQALSRVVLGAVDAAMPQPAAAPQQVPVQQAPMPQQVAPVAASQEGPVMLRPWSERNAPVPAVSAPAQYTPPATLPSGPPVPAGDAAFVF
ncbi:lytic transglycosylase domain-containing protein [Stenotrophomonas oahuensis]|uniref:Lytic transglycosylase domain-containing protein n=1 Tax=Stenotrophomonas oahuensis TaxID=3003271 RepID=A0ABY9YNM9_9GAMM|nr:lytic transglycosylase domain-containing protein [Stenotrophomonas sp. A5586]WNH52510.1 lytic transglycosylase domain-containing protein [Stenotrophomonas sp. A5586]